MAPFIFDEIASDWLEPGIFLEVKPNYRNMGILPYPTKPLIIGAKLAAGTLVPGTIVEITRPAEAIALFGLGSIGAEMVTAFRKANKTSSLHVIALADDAGGVAATKTITFAGAITAALVLRFLIGGKQIRFTAAAAATMTQLATALAAAINADTSLPVTATSAAAVVTLTSRHKGEVGNEIDVRVDTRAQPLPSGLTATIAAGVAGSGNPDIQPALDAIASSWFTNITMPWNDTTNLGKFDLWLRERYKAMSKLDAHGFVGKSATFVDLSTWGDLTNSPFLTCVGLKRPPTSPWVFAASVAGLAAFHLTNDPARQLRSLVVPGVVAPDAADQFIETEQDLLLRKGISTFDCLPDGSVTISRLITTYKMSNLAVADRAWIDIMVPATMSRIRYDWSGYVSLQYPRAKLTDDESSAVFGTRQDGDEDPGNAVVTPRRMHGSWGGRCRLYAERAWIEDVDRTVKESVFQRSQDDRNRLESRQQLQIIGNLMVLAGSLEFQV